jgi:8-oxo-dGTP pyrophosphatase MutT (NUDIX family)
VPHEPEARPPPPARSVEPPEGSDIRVEQSAGGVVVRAVDGTPHVLLIRDPYRKWGLPKGHLEEEEGPEEAAVREVREETGLEHLILGPDLGEIDWSFRQRGRRIHKYCRFYLMASFHGECSPEEGEGISACRWLPPADALATVSYANARRIVQRALDRIPERLPPRGLPWEPVEGKG